MPVTADWAHAMSQRRKEWQGNGTREQSFGPVRPRDRADRAECSWFRGSSVIGAVAGQRNPSGTSRNATGIPYSAWCAMP